MFRIGKYVLNEYELRTLCSETAKGRTDFVGKKVTCLLSKQTCTIQKDGRLSNPIKGISLITEIMEEMLLGRV